MQGKRRQKRVLFQPPKMSFIKPTECSHYQVSDVSDVDVYAPQHTYWLVTCGHTNSMQTGSAWGHNHRKAIISYHHFTPMGCKLKTENERLSGEDSHDVGRSQHDVAGAVRALELTPCILGVQHGAASRH